VKYLTRALSKLQDVYIEVRTPVGGNKDAGHAEIDGVRIKRYRTCANFSTAHASSHDARLYRVIETLSQNLAIIAEPIESEVVHTHTWYANMAGVWAKRLYGVKTVATVHTLEPQRPWKAEQLGPGGYELSTWLERTGLRDCDHVIAVSEAIKKDLINIYGINDSRIAVIPNGIDVEKYTPTHKPAVIEKYGIKRPYVLFVGRLSRQKGIFDLLRAARYLRKDAQIVLLTGKADTSELVNELNNAIKSLRHAGKNILWVNRVVPEDELISLYSYARVFVCPSVYEPFGIINLEAMACGVPVVASRVGGIPEVVMDEVTGTLVPPGEPKQLADAVNVLLDDEELARAMGKAGRERVERAFSWEAIAEKTLEVYESIL
jgi:glycogen synthase